MKITFKKLNKTFEVAEGSVVIRNKNETLDSAVVKILNLSEEDKIEVQPLDLCSLIDDDDRFGEIFYMCIDDVSETMECVNPRIYSYEIKLVSETKLLEGIPLPNLSITNIADEPRTVWYYLDQYLYEYGENIRVGTDSSNYSWQPGWRFANRVQTRFEAIQCPEMQWNEPTLREVLNDLMMVNDCIVIMKNGVIDYIDLTEINKDISSDAHINYVNQSRSSVDYISELQMDLKNVLQTKLDGVNNLVSTSEYLMFNTDGYLVTDQNFKLVTRYPIYKVKHLYIWLSASLYDSDSGVEHLYKRVFQKIDLCDFGSDHINLVYEEKEFYTLDVIVRSNLGSGFPQYSDWGKYQNTSIFFTRGNNQIQNFNYLTNYGYVISGSSNLFNLLLGELFGMWDNYKANYKNVFFQIEYETTADALFRASKTEYPNNYRVIQDNQTNSYIDSYNQGFMEYQKANRLGNKIKFINARYENTEAILFWLHGERVEGLRDEKNDMVRNNNPYYAWKVENDSTKYYTNTLSIIDGTTVVWVLQGNSMVTVGYISTHYLKRPLQLGDTFDEAIVYQVQYQIYKNHIEVNAQATEGYVLRDYFTGVKAKVRSWKIVDGNEAFERHDLIKYYCEFSYNQHRELGLNSFNGSNIARYLSSGAINNNSPEPLKYAMVQTFGFETDGQGDENDVYFPSEESTEGAHDGYYNLELSERIVGNSLVFDFGFLDNFAAVKMPKYTNEQGNSIITFDSDELLSFTGYNGIPLLDKRYVNNNGEFESIDIYFSNETNLPDIPETTYSRDEGIIYPSADFEDAIRKYCRTPLYYESEFTKSFGIPYNHHKDNKEIIRVSTQFEFCSEDKTITFTKEFLQRQFAVSTVQTGTLDVYVNGTKMTTGYWDILVSPINDTVCRINLQTNHISSLSQTDLIEFKTSAGNLVLSFIAKDVTTVVPSLDIGYTGIYLNILRDRRKAIYDNVTDQNIIDTI